MIFCGCFIEFTIIDAYSPTRNGSCWNKFIIFIGYDSLELMLPRSLKKNTKCVNAAGEELSAVKHKLMLLDTTAERS
uniref:Uncharacterized protein n=1 Tax=Tanacetum cinerariifolium TaxID=118510 RepID=A0A6L2MFI0_TANCI|nr:hypothetical protein [Tanacetum cinerariifolium]